MVELDTWRRIDILFHPAGRLKESAGYADETFPFRNVLPTRNSCTIDDRSCTCARDASIIAVVFTSILLLALNLLLEAPAKLRITRYVYLVVAPTQRFRGFVVRRARNSFNS